MKSFPLSWSYTSKNISYSKRITSKKIEWLAFEKVQVNSIQFPSIPLKRKKEVIIRGCNSEVTQLLSKNNFDSFQFGMEAILKTSYNHFSKKSLLSLIKRGKRHGSVSELVFNKKNNSLLAELINNSMHGSEPQLTNLFQTEYNNTHNLFVFVGKNSVWLGAILVSENSKSKLHTELLIRRKNAPPGIMEALIHKVFLYSRSHNFEELSLGEVPFKFSESNKSLKKIILKIAGSLINFSYNHNGLYSFKNKFNPFWQPLNICAFPKIKTKHFLFIFAKSNFHKLFFYKILYTIKNNSPSLIINKGQKYIPIQLDFNKT